jgi:nucleotide-binding universal stress UspA family protein
MKTATLPVTRRFPRISCRIRPRITKSAHLKIKNVLVPIDFSERSLEALETALSLTKQTGAQLHLIHVCAPDYPFTTVMAMPIALPLMQVAQGVRRHLKGVAKKYGVELRPGNTHAVEGNPFEEICGIASEQKIDLIVATTRGNTGMKHLLLGSTAERIVRYSPCPVLVVHPKAKNGKPARSNLMFGKILVPIDFSDCSLKGLEYAKTLAKEFGSKLVLLNSVALPYIITTDDYARYDLPLLMQEAGKAARRQMRELVDQTAAEGIEVTLSLHTGHAGEQICAQAAGARADLIVTSTHGTTGFKHILVGSTAEYVVRHAPCPVLVVPNHERPARTFARGEIR